MFKSRILEMDDQEIQNFSGEGMDLIIVQLAKINNYFFSVFIFFLHFLFSLNIISIFIILFLFDVIILFQYEFIFYIYFIFS